MVARLELYNTLAPIQEYGRHQTMATNKKKSKVPIPTQQAEEAGKPNFNEQFYDLDDAFIDDDFGGEVDEMGADLHADDIQVYS